MCSIDVPPKGHDVFLSVILPMSCLPALICSVFLLQSPVSILSLSGLSQLGLTRPPLPALSPVCPLSPPQTVEHGFPHQPSALSYSPSLQLLAIGTRSGAIKLYPSLNDCVHA